jgi:hypothetical protein
MKYQGTKPDFICIGYEKTATTWLWNRLNEHPSVAMPPVKEVGFWLEDEIIEKKSVLGKFLSGHWYYRKYRKILMRSLVKPYWFLTHARWILRFLFGRHTIGWYSSLFDRKKISGDITPTYTDLAESRIKEIYMLNPEIKIILLLRDPVDYAWSKAKMNLVYQQGKIISDITEKEYFDFFDTLRINDTSYTDVFIRWKKYFNMIFIGFYDEIENDPKNILGKIYSFLGLSAIEQGNFSKKSNVGIEMDIPEKYREYLVSKYTKLMQDCISLFGPDSMAAEWLKKYGIPMQVNKGKS